jgi:FMN phosphatase YigB (HAD superfamily)
LTPQTSNARPLPFEDIDTVFLDVGNTLISIDFDWVASELGTRSVACLADALRRAEASARPSYSHRLFVEGVPPDTDQFRAYLTAMIERIPEAAALPADRFDTVLTELRRVLRPDGRASVLWRRVMDGIPDALARMKAHGLALVVVSNSDGTVEESLIEAGLRPYLTAVVDSALAGYEKPDRRIFEHALALTGARPERTLHVGDLYHADVLGARGAGIHGLLLDPYGDWTDVDCVRAPDLGAVAALLGA